MRARLGQGLGNHPLTVLCDDDMVSHLCRVVVWAGGYIIEQCHSADGTLLRIGLK